MMAAMDRYRRLPLPLLPIENSESVHAEALSRALLGKSQLEAVLPQMLSRRLGLKVGFVWFQCFKRYGHGWQKGNTSVSVRFPRPLFRQMPLHAGSGHALSQSHLRPAPRPHRPSHRGSGRTREGPRLAPVRRVERSHTRACNGSARPPDCTAGKTECPPVGQGAGGTLHCRGGCGSACTQSDQPTWVIGTRLPPHPQGRAHHCGSGRCLRYFHDARGGSRSVPALRADLIRLGSLRRRKTAH
jgi:hypothetical protein